MMLCQRGALIPERLRHNTCWRALRPATSGEHERCDCGQRVAVIHALFLLLVDARARWGDGNGYSMKVKSALFLTVPFPNRISCFSSLWVVPTADYVRAAPAN